MGGCGRGGVRLFMRLFVLFSFFLAVPERQFYILLVLIPLALLFRLGPGFFFRFCRSV